MLLVSLAISIAKRVENRIEVDRKRDRFFLRRGEQIQRLSKSNLSEFSR